MADDLTVYGGEVCQCTQNTCIINSCHLQKPEMVDAAYWRKPSYIDVAGDSDPSADPGSGWFCLLYWGDQNFRSRSPHFYGCYFLVVKGTGSSARFTLASAGDLLNEQNGIFSV